MIRFSSYIMVLIGLTSLGAGCTPVNRENRLPDKKPPSVVIDPYSNEIVEEPIQVGSTTTAINKSITNQNYMMAILHTSMGDITIELNDATPNTVANFVKLAQSGFYDGTKFHRVIEGFMNQGGDPLSKDDGKVQLWGTGGPGYTFADEIKPDNHNDKGTISMANAGPNTNGSQFFLNVAPNNFLDTKHTVFGKVTAGYDVVEAINQVPTGSGDRPLGPVTIKNITLK